MNEADSGNNDYLDGLLKHREALLELRNDQLKTFDKAILTVSSGALGLSIAFVDKFNGGREGFGLLLFLSWSAFGAAIVCNILSYLTGFQDADREISKIDRCIREASEWKRGENLFRTLTYALNILALILFSSGVIMLAVHAYRSTTPG